MASVRFGFDVDVACAVAEAFAYVSDPDRLPEWQGAAEVEKLTEGPVRQGTRLREVHEAMGRRIESITEVTAFEPDKRFAIRIVEGPLPIDGDWTFAPRGDRTRIHFTASGELHGAKALLKPLLLAAMKRQFRAHHRRLKEALER